jgi:heat shock protein HslJ
VGSWELVEATTDGTPLRLPDEGRATLTIESARLGGTSFCNSYGGTYHRSGDGLVIDELAATEMGCSPELMAAESAYLDALAVAIDRVRVEADDLELTGADTVLRFRRLPPVPVSALVGTRWVLESLVDGEVASSVTGEPAVLVLSDDGTIEASTGCRLFTGTWRTYGDQIVVPESAMEGECPADLAGQDAHVTAALGDGFRVEVAGDRLTLTGRDGQGLVYRAS